jgi:DNA-3-methyladenine glycosylase II
MYKLSTTSSGPSLQLHNTMPPATRASLAATTSLASTFKAGKPSTAGSSTKRKRTTTSAPPPAPSPSSSKRLKPIASDTSTPVEVAPLPTFDVSHTTHDIIPASELHFDFEHARQHLVRADKRFERVFDRLRCKPFQDLEDVDPFRYVERGFLAGRVMMAERLDREPTIGHSSHPSLANKSHGWLLVPSTTSSEDSSIRLYQKRQERKAKDGEGTSTASLWTLDDCRRLMAHRTPPSRSPTYFPSPADVMKLDIAQLKTAGLSTRKAEYGMSLPSPRVCASAV